MIEPPASSRRRSSLPTPWILAGAAMDSSHIEAARRTQAQRNIARSNTDPRHTGRHFRRVAGRTIQRLRGNQSFAGNLLRRAGSHRFPTAQVNNSANNGPGSALPHRNIRGNTFDYRKECHGPPELQIRFRCETDGLGKNIVRPMGTLDPTGKTESRCAIPKSPLDDRRVELGIALPA